MLCYYLYYYSLQSPEHLVDQRVLPLAFLLRTVL